MERAAGNGQRTGCYPGRLGARDTLRLEAGLPLYGHELGSDVEGKEIPVFALPAARFGVSFSRDKGEFIGREALIKQFQEIKLRQEGKLDITKEKLLVPRAIFLMSICGGGVARAGCPVYENESLVGNVTSGTVVPYWQTEGAGIEARPGGEFQRRAICLAYIDAGLKEGQRVQVVIRDKTAEAIIIRRHIGNEAPPYARPLLVEV